MYKRLTKKLINNNSAKIYIFEKSLIKFKIKRIYIIKNNSHFYNFRKGHAHKKLQQIISCLNGKIKIKLDNGKKKKTIILNSLSNPIFLKKGIWREITYLEKDTILHVICSNEYSESDYIRDYKMFLKWKKFNT